jgi:hypothetical protein
MSWTERKQQINAFLNRDIKLNPIEKGAEKPRKERKNKPVISKKTEGSARSYFKGIKMRI